MDSRQQQPQQRELVFCHQCENEWYRDEHGIICPECHGDFTEIIEGDHDTHEDYGTSAFPSSRAPDPDEGDDGIALDGGLSDIEFNAPQVDGNAVD